MKTLAGKDFQWPAWQDIGPLFTMTCINHQFLRWSSKHPVHRSLHYLGLADGVEITKENVKYAFQECDCSYDDLRVIDKEEDNAV